MSLLLLAVPLLPLLAGLLALGAGRRAPNACGWLVVGAIALGLAALLPLRGGASIGTLWFASGGLRFSVGLEAEGLTWFVAMVVAGVSAGVGLYSIGYFAQPEDKPRFFAALGLFVGAMLGLVLASSFIVLFAAWEVVGAASYMLIGFHYRDPAAAAAATKAFLMTRIGDMGLLLGWLLAVAATGSSDIGTALLALPSSGLAPAVALLTLAGVAGKSAQLPLTGWLPDAMVGPTPVSALLHSATMVAAGIFLVLRLYPLFEAAPAALSAAVWIGAATALVASLIATAETDLKRVLAWSTSAQLGEMLVATGLGGPLAAGFHLATHAVCKSTLFLAAGAVQKRTGTRDMRRLGGLVRAAPLTATVFATSAAALAGLPPLSAYWSEEAMLAVAARQGAVTALGLCVLFGLASLYVGRAAGATFLGRHRGDAMPHGPAPWAMAAGMVGLAAAAVLAGWLLAGRLPALLGGPAAPEAPGAWSTVALLAVAAGLLLGLTSGWRRGAAPVLGAFPLVLRDGLAAATALPARWISRVAQVVNGLERHLNELAMAASDRASRVATACGGGERRLDAAGAAGASLTWRLAGEVSAAETRGFGQGGDLLAAAIGASGERLRGLQTGKLYLYTLGLFAWVAAALAAGVLLLF